MTILETLEYIKEHIDLLSKFQINFEEKDYGKGTLTGQIKSDYIEIAMTNGPSWYFYNYPAVSIISLSKVAKIYTDKGKFDVRVNIRKLLDVYGDLDKIVKWINLEDFVQHTYMAATTPMGEALEDLVAWIRSKNSDIMKIIIGYGKRVKELGLCKYNSELSRIPITYTIDDIDHSFNSKCFLINIPYVKSDKKGERSVSIIFQVREDIETKKISIWMTKRELLKTSWDSYTNVTDIKPEIEVTNFKENPKIVFDYVKNAFKEEAIKLVDEIPKLKEYLGYIDTFLSGD